MGLRGLLGECRGFVRMGVAGVIGEGWRRGFGGMGSSGCVGIVGRLLEIRYFILGIGYCCVGVSDE